MRSDKDSPPSPPAYASRSAGSHAAGAIPATLLVLAIGSIVAPFAGMFLSALLHLPVSGTGVLAAVWGALTLALLALLFGPLIAFPGALAYALMLLALPQERLRSRYRNHPWLTSIVLGAGAGAAIGAVTSQLMGVAMDFGPAAPLGGAVSSTLGLKVYVRLCEGAV